MIDLELWKRKKKELHLSYDEIAANSGIPKTTVTNIFMGRTQNPRIDTVQAIERAIGIDEKKSVIERPTSEIAENFIREYSEQIKEKIFQDIAKLYKAINDANLKMQILAVLVAYLNRNGINTENIVGY